MATQRARLERAWRVGLAVPWRIVLTPAMLAYRGGLALRRAAYAVGVFRRRSLPCRVIAVGNLSMGGTGKTPLVELMTRTLEAEGRRVVILSRGYGRRRGHDAVRVVSDGTRVLLTAAEAGDEPVLLARHLPGVPVVVGRDRARAGAWALARFAPDVLVLDDGFQHMRLRKDVEVVCLDARAPWGHGGLLPRGSLREPPAALSRADLLVLTHSTAAAERPGVMAEVRRWAPSAPVAHAAYEAEAIDDLASGARLPLDALRGQPVLAFAGIAVPESFAGTLAGLGVTPREFVVFPDHHPYDRGDIRRLQERARSVGAELLLTTEKDAVRLPEAGRDDGIVSVWALRVRLRLSDESVWWKVLETHLAAR